MIRLVALVVFFLTSPALFAAKPPKSLLGIWEGTQETRYSRFSSVDPNGTSTVHLRSTWKVRGASYVWTERVFSSANGRLLGTRVITLKFNGEASIKATDGTHFKGWWTYVKKHNKLVISGQVPDDTVSDGVLMFQNVIRISTDSYRIQGGTSAGVIGYITSVSTVEQKQ